MRCIRCWDGGAIRDPNLADVLCYRYATCVALGSHGIYGKWIADGVTLWCRTWKHGVSWQAADRYDWYVVRKRVEWGMGDNGWYEVVCS